MNFAPFRQFVATVWLAALALLATSACQTAPPITDPQPPGHASTLPQERITGTRGGALSYRVTSPPKTFNFLLMDSEATYTVAFMLLGGRLIEFDHDQQIYVPGLAESWQLGADGKTMELTLRENLKFSDGRPLTTADVAFTLQAIYDPRTASTVRSTLIINERQIEATPVDARRLRLVFPETVAAPETYLSIIAVLPRHALIEPWQNGTLKDAYHITTPPERVVTAGPFTVEAVVPGERVTLKRNPHYWKKDAAGTALPYLDQINIVVVSDANAALTQLSQGALDIIDRIRSTDYASLKDQSSSPPVRAYDLGPGLSTDYIWFNLNEGAPKGRPVVDPIKRAWFNDVRFRQAVAYAIDRQSMVSTILQGLATPLYGFIPPSNRAWVAEDLPRTTYDLEKARVLLNEAGFVRRGSNEAPELFDARGHRVEFTLIVPVENEARKAMAAIVQEDLARLGIKMQIAPIEFGALRSRILESLDYDAVLLGYLPTDTDPSSTSTILKSSSPEHQWHPNQTRPATPWEAQIDELFPLLSRETDVARRRAIFREIQLKVIENQAIIPLVARHIVVAANVRVGNYRPSVIIPYSIWNADELFIKHN